MMLLLLKEGGNPAMSSCLLLTALACLIGNTHGIGDILSRLYMKPCEDGNGVCMSRGECSVRGGSNVGNCELGACCQIPKTCDQEAVLNNTYFVNPNTTNSADICSLFVRKVLHRDSICQMRLDFQEFDIVGPDTSGGSCGNDALTITGQNNDVPVICGYNLKQHVYLDVKGSGTGVRLNISQNRTITATRRWKIRISQIPCRSEHLAPAGCLQYFEKSEGRIQSFNYGNPTALETTTTYPIVGMRYSICFQKSCRLAVRKSGPFGLTEEAEMSYTNIKTANIDQECFRPHEPGWSSQRSYIGFDNVRFCKNNFPILYTSVNPISRIDVLMYPNENQNSRRDGWVGFQLEYTQMCDSRGYFQVGSAGNTHPTEFPLPKPE